VLLAALGAALAELRVVERQLAAQQLALQAAQPALRVSEAAHVRWPLSAAAALLLLFIEPRAVARTVPPRRACSARSRLLQPAGRATRASLEATVAGHTRAPAPRALLH